MRKLILILCLCLTSFTAYSDVDRQVALYIETVTATGYVRAGTRSLIFIFSSGFTGTIQGAAFAGSTDASINIPVMKGDTLNDVYYTVTAGSMRIVYTK